MTVLGSVLSDAELRQVLGDARTHALNLAATARRIEATVETLLAFVADVTPGTAEDEAAMGRIRENLDACRQQLARTGAGLDRIAGVQ